jgi:serine/threonine protein kinase
VFVCPKCGASYADPGFCGGDGTKLSAVEDDMMLGTTVGVYRIASLVGVGGWGRVYKGVHPEIGSRVAIKVLSRDFSNPELIKRFFNEARAVNLIRHENIVNVIDLAQLPDKRPYIVMEYLDGLSLAKHIANQGTLGISETCRICAESLDALAVAHEKGIIHRDLKPDNLFITPEGRAKVLDFGIAKLREDDTPDAAQTRAGSLIGTPHFMSPEQALARPVDPRSDIYSMGVILFQCLTGKFPFHADSVLELARAHVEMAPVSPRSLRPDIPPELDALVLRALAKDPVERWQDAAALSAALKRIGAQNPGQRTKSLAVESGVQHTPSGIPPTQIAGPHASAPVLTPHVPTNGAAPGAPSTAGPSSKRGLLFVVVLFAVLGLGLAIFLLQSNKDDVSVSVSVSDNSTSTMNEIGGGSHAGASSTNGVSNTNGAGAGTTTAVQEPTAGPEVNTDPIVVPEASDACKNPEDHCLPDNELYFAATKDWVRDVVAMDIADQLTPPDDAGEAMFRVRTTKKEYPTQAFYKTRKAMREDLVVGRKAIYFHDHSESGIFHAPATSVFATTQRWYLGRIVSIDGLSSGSYVLLAGGYKVDAGAIRTIIGDTSDTAEEQGPVDSHFLRANHWLTTIGPLTNSPDTAAFVGVPITAPSSKTKGQGRFILTTTGKQLWTEYAWQTRVGKDKDLTIGTRVFMLRDNRDPDKVYRAPSTQALSARWWTALITDDSVAFKGQVGVGDGRLVDAKAVRVLVE